MAIVKTLIAPFVAFVQVRQHLQKNAYSVINTVLICIILEFLIYLFFFEGSWLHYGKGPFHVMGNDLPNKVVITLKPGDRVPMVVSRCSTADTVRTYNISRRLVRADVSAQPWVYMPSLTADIEANHCDNAVSLAHVLPLTMPVEVTKGNFVQVPLPAGLYYLRGCADVPGYVRTNVECWRSEEFQVVAREP